MKLPICKNSNCNNQVKNKKRQYCSRACKNRDREFIKYTLQKREKTYQEKYNGKHPMATKEVQEKHKKALKDKYGVEHALQSDKIKQKVKNTLKERYGNENYNNLESIQKTKKERYGHHAYNNQPLQRLNAKKKKLKWNHIEILDLFENKKINDPNEKYTIKCTKCGFTWQCLLMNNYMPRCKKCSSKEKDPIYTSKIHQEVLDFLKNELQIKNVKKNDRTILQNGTELDIYLPDYKVGIEINGTYFHSDAIQKDKFYHHTKTRLGIWAGIQVIHLFDNFWIQKEELVKSMIRSKLGLLPKRVYARNTYIDPSIKSREKIDFFEKNHLHGNVKSTYNIGLRDKKTDELLSVATFSKSRYVKDIDFELIRFATKQNTTVIGGFQKILKAFTKEFNNPTIISYADRTWSTGKIYLSSGFTFTGFTPPNYRYTKNRELYSRERFQKHKLKNLFENFDPNLTEAENMRRNGYHRIYDSGNMRFVFRSQFS